jgi:hypothetical protein
VLIMHARAGVNIEKPSASPKPRRSRESASALEDGGPDSRCRVATSEARTGVRLVPSAVLARPGERIAYSLVNRGLAAAVWGAAFRLERREGDRWVPSGPTDASRAVGYGLSPGQEKELSLAIPDDAQPGRYRVSKDVATHPDSEGAGTPNASAWSTFAERGRRSETVSFELDVVAT